MTTTVQLQTQVVKAPVPNSSSPLLLPLNDAIAANIPFNLVRLSTSIPPIHGLNTMMLLSFLETCIRLEPQRRWCSGLRR